MDPVVDLQIWRYRLPLTEPLVLGAKTLDHRRGLLLQLVSKSGAAGWGEVAPLPEFSHETLDEAADQLRKVRRNELNDLPSHELSRLIASTDHTSEEPWRAFALFPSVRFGIEQALLSLEAARKHVSVPNLFRNDPPPDIRINGLLIGDSIEILRKAAEAVSQEGYRAVKLKVGRRSVAADIQRVRAVRDVLENGVSLRLDANRRWTLEQALTFAKQVADCSIEYLEEPLAAPEQLEAFAAKSSIPTALDETIRAVEPAALSNYPFSRAIILKPTLMGGFVRSAWYIRTARSHGMTPVVSASFESGLGLLGLGWLAAGLNLEHIPAGLDTWKWLKGDLLEPPLQCSRGRLSRVDIDPRQLSINREYLTSLQ